MATARTMLGPLRSCMYSKSYARLIARGSSCLDQRRPQTQERCLHSTTQIIDNEPPPDAILSASTSAAPSNLAMPHPQAAHVTGGRGGIFTPQYDLRRAPSPPSGINAIERPPLTVTDSLRSQLSQLVAQPPFYATIHIHGKPYLVTPGDTVRLPFLMHGVMPGDVLRLDRATTIGSRDFTLKGGKSLNSNAESGTQLDKSTMTEPIFGKTDDLPHTPYPGSSTAETGKEAGLKKKGPPAYLDDRLFVCRATVMGTESEPMRVKEKTKRRQRHIKHVKSKHKYTVIRISEISPKD